jgi:hypothetical protein
MQPSCTQVRNLFRVVAKDAGKDAARAAGRDAAKAGARAAARAGEQRVLARRHPLAPWRNLCATGRAGRRRR